jgi:hypothetical protein
MRGTIFYLGEVITGGDGQKFYHEGLKGHHEETQSLFGYKGTKAQSNSLNVSS